MLRHQFLQGLAPCEEIHRHRGRRPPRHINYTQTASLVVEMVQHSLHNPRLPLLEFQNVEAHCFVVALGDGPCWRQFAVQHRASLKVVAQQRGGQQLVDDLDSISVTDNIVDSLIAQLKDVQLFTPLQILAHHLHGILNHATARPEKT